MRPTCFRPSANTFFSGDFYSRAAALIPGPFPPSATVATLLTSSVAFVRILCASVRHTTGEVTDALRQTKGNRLSSASRLSSRAKMPVRRAGAERSAGIAPSAQFT